MVDDPTAPQSPEPQNEDVPNVPPEVLPSEPAAPAPPRATAPPPPPPPTVPPTVPVPRMAPGWQTPAGMTPPAVPPRRASTALWVILAILLLGVVTIGVGGYLFSQSSGGLDGGSFLAEKIGVVTVEGVISDGGRGGLLFGPSGARAIMEDLRAAADDDSLKAVIVLINSPGGSPAASHAIYEEITRLRAKKKVVACMTDVAASGGYYVASACDKIVAQGSTLTGSIGVIFGGVSYYGLMKKLGLQNATQTAGKYKDVGSPLRPMNPEEKALLQGMLNDIYGQFVQAVADGRNLKVSRVRQLAEGRVYTGQQAKAVGLVDELGNFYDAVKLTGKLAGIKGEPKVKYMEMPRGLLGEFMASSERFGGLFGGQSLGRLPTAIPLQGPMLLLPYVYEMVPMVQAARP